MWTICMVGWPPAMLSLPVPLSSSIFFKVQKFTFLKGFTHLQTNSSIHLAIHHAITPSPQGVDSAEVTSKSVLRCGRSQTLEKCSVVSTELDLGTQTAICIHMNYLKVVAGLTCSSLGEPAGDWRNTGCHWVGKTHLNSHRIWDTFLTCTEITSILYFWSM